MTPEEIARLPVTQTLFAYDGKYKRFACYPGDYAIDEIAYALPAPHRNRGCIYREASRGGCLVNVGAHVGTVAIVAADFFSRCYAFEPASRNFDLLKHNISLNNVNNVIPNRIAFADWWGETDLYLCGDDKAVCHSLNQQVTGSGRSEKVPVNTLDDYFASIRDCTMLMIDAEGYDMKILSAGEKFLSRQLVTPIIVIEFAPQFWSRCGSTAVDLISFAERNGYGIFSDFGNNFSPVSPCALKELYAIWKNTCQAWLDLYLVRRGEFCGIFPNPI